MYHHILFLTFLFTLLSVAWFGSFINQDDPATSKTEPLQIIEEADGEYSEFYYMKGIQISQSLCYLSNFCEPGEAVESDTLKTSFLVKLTFSSERPDSILFDGLEGVNIGPRKIIGGGFAGPAAYPECSSTSMECGYARVINNKLKFELSSPSGFYTGTGTIENDRMTIQGQYFRRNVGVKYLLEGQRIVGIE